MFNFIEFLINYGIEQLHNSQLMEVKFYTNLNSALPNIESYGIQNLRIYVSTCHTSCKSCDGPLENDCLSCPINSSLSGGICQCKTLIYGQCLKYCPIYNILQNGVCIDKKLLEINKSSETQVITDLMSDEFNHFEVIQEGWYYSLESPQLSSYSSSSCQNRKLLLGFGSSYYNTYSSSQYIQKTFTNLPSHYYIRVRATVYLGDKWNIGEYIKLGTGSTEDIYTISSVSSEDLGCGGPQQYGDRIVTLDSGLISHTSSTYTFKIEWKALYGSYSQWIGFREISILLQQKNLLCQIYVGSQFNECFQCIGVANQSKSREVNNFCKCPSGFYDNYPQQDDCQSCPAECPNCVSSTICSMNCSQKCGNLGCDHQDKCNNCQDYEHKFENSYKQKLIIYEHIQECDILCATCSQSGYCDTYCDEFCGDQGCYSNGICKNCKTFFTLFEGVCIPQENCIYNQSGICTDCLEGYILDTQNNKCTLCPLECASCDQNFQCILYCNLNCKGRCNTDGTCIDCIGEYNLVNGQCIKCLDSCGSLRCDSPTTCNNCIPGYYLDSQICYQCDSKCLECENSADNCTICKNNFNGKRELPECECQQNYVEFNLQCVKCLDSCGSLGCDHPNTCNNCIPGYYLNQYSQTCLSCSRKCEECEISLDNCTICANNSDNSRNIPECECKQNYIEIGMKCFKCQDIYIQNLSEFLICEEYTNAKDAKLIIKNAFFLIQRQII
ncbi:Insulin-like growth factor binding protein, N-terminal [Pseudocohnilembus persalinus]|uniref:Insulin-like growth factor binding protein, N-terminal n=1 Tax=Pseudocohnilembus persalinus TaxID=266149 RepID=A0A0V0QSF2_PSEPJ|nr:Insulin-like growth factor binding protein, N-terminal [Pseudocohnilembus persalinus]|eukprot:KRX05174.1 Insulin-like growth factor binding protein, N-terminal [Pseudocohnilembus persalinus]